MSSIPSDLLSAILVRVPAEAVFNLRLVCKAWLRLIDDPYFRKTHTIMHNNSNNQEEEEEDSQYLFFVKLYEPSFLSLKSLFNYDDFSSTEFEFRTSIIPQELYDDCSRFYVCNGLVLIENKYHYQDSFDGWVSPWCIVNPLTREIHKLPLYPHWEEGELSNSTTGFGYDSASDDYKFVYHTSFSCGKSFETFIYSMKSNSWRKNKYGSRFIPMYWERGVFSDGALHWIGDTDKLVALDLGTEEMRFVSMGKPMFCRFEDLDFDSLGGSIAMVETGLSNRDMNIYVMGTYGDETSWKTLYSSNNYKFNGEVRLISYSATKQILLLFLLEENEFLLVNLKTNTSQNREMTIKPSDLCISSSQLFRPSFVRIVQ